MSYRVQVLVNFLSSKGRSAGWSLTFYNNAGTPDVAFADTVSLADKINVAMGKQAIPVAARLSELAGGDNKIIAGTRQVTVRRFDAFAVLGSASGLECADPNKCLVMRDHSGIYSRTWNLNGIPDAQEVSGGDYVPSGNYVEKINALVAELISPFRAWRLRVQDRTVAKFDVAGITAGGIVTTSAAHGYATGAFVRLIDNRGEGRFNGRYKITVLSPTTFQLQASIPPDFVITGGNPKVYQEKLILLAYATPGGALPAVEVVRGGTKQVGRPFDQFTGKRAA